MAGSKSATAVVSAFRCADNVSWPTDGGGASIGTPARTSTGPEVKSAARNIRSDGRRLTLAMRSVSHAAWGWAAPAVSTSGNRIPGLEIMAEIVSPDAPASNAFCTSAVRRIACGSSSGAFVGSRSKSCGRQPDPTAARHTASRQIRSLRKGGTTIQRACDDERFTRRATRHKLQPLPRCRRTTWLSRLQL